MHTETFQVSGMKCRGCAGAVTRALEAVAGVLDVNVRLDDGAVTVRFDERTTQPARLADSIRQAGYGVLGHDPESTRPAAGGCCCR